MTELCSLARKWGTDKALYYTEFYDAMLGKRRKQVRKVLEIGIGYPELMREPVSRLGLSDYMTGASLYMWEEYFPNALIFALDKLEDTFVNDGRISSFYLDQGDEASYRQAIACVGSDFDLIIDDGSHVKADQLLSVKMFVPLLRYGGYYIMEDAPVGVDHDPEFFRQIEYRHGVANFGVGSKDPARLVVIRR